MEIRDVFVTGLGLLIYSGPLMPLLAPLMFKRASLQRFRINLRILFIATSLQALSIVPFVLAEAGQEPESELKLWYPFGLGVLTFITASIYAVVECIHLRSLSRSSHAA